MGSGGGMGSVGGGMGSDRVPQPRGGMGSGPPWGQTEFQVNLKLGLTPHASLFVAPRTPIFPGFSRMVARLFANPRRLSKNSICALKPGEISKVYGRKTLAIPPILSIQMLFLDSLLGGRWGFKNSRIPHFSRLSWLLGTAKWAKVELRAAGRDGCGNPGVREQGPWGYSARCVIADSTHTTRMTAGMRRADSERRSQNHDGLSHGRHSTLPYGFHDTGPQRSSRQRLLPILCILLQERGMSPGLCPSSLHCMSFSRPFPSPEPSPVTIPSGVANAIAPRP